MSGLEDAAILTSFVDRLDDLETAFARFSAFRRRRVRVIVRESRLLGRILNLRPAFLSAAASRASVIVPEAALTRHLAGVAARSAFVLPTRADTQRSGREEPRQGVQRATPNAASGLSSVEHS